VQQALDAEVDAYLGQPDGEEEATPRRTLRGFTFKTEYLRIGDDTLPLDLTLRVPQVLSGVLTYRSQLLEVVIANADKLARLCLSVYLREPFVGDVEAVFTNPHTGDIVLQRRVVLDIAMQLRADHHTFRGRDLSTFQLEQVFLEPLRISADSPFAPRSDVLCAWGVRYDRRKFLLHLEEGNQDNLPTWREFMRNMQVRGLPTPQYIYVPRPATLLPVVRALYPKRAWHRLAPSLVVGLGGAALLLAVFDVQSPLRVLTAAVFLLIGPGLAFVRLLTLKDTLAEVTLSVVFSLAIHTLISEALVLARVWSGTLGLAISVALVLGANVLELILNYRHISRHDWAYYDTGH
jgi:hypothetical protein